MKTTTKVAVLNTVVSDFREWQRGAITRREMEARAGTYLTAEQVARLPNSRITEHRALAQKVAEILEL